MFNPTLLQDPKTRQKLLLREGALVSQDGKTHYPILDGIPSLLKKGDVFGSNAKYQKLYDRIGRLTGAVFWALCRLFRLDTVSKRQDLLSDLSIPSGACILETSIGAGANIPALPLEATYYGVDISMGMLRACQRYQLTHPYNLHLLHANAEHLPFADNTFDVVFHFGGINFFTDIPQAIAEMLRVAKPGATIWIGDETEKHIDGWYRKIPFVSRYFKDTNPVAPPLASIPTDVENLQLTTKWKDSVYTISFKKPLNSTCELS